jgi:hypothetical protein
VHGRTAASTDGHSNPQHAVAFINSCICSTLVIYAKAPTSSERPVVSSVLLQLVHGRTAAGTDGHTRLQRFAAFINACITQPTLCLCCCNTCSWCTGALLPAPMAAPIRSMAIDSRHQCWAGDESGYIKVVGWDPRLNRLSSVRLQDGPNTSAAAGWGAGASGAAPVHAMLAHNNALFSSGGRYAASTTLIQCTSAPA